MPNINGLYNFNELCLKAGASAPWIKKVQRFLNLGEGDGSKGARTYYTTDQVHIYSTVKMLRMMDIEFEDIKHIYELENKIINLSSGLSHEKVFEGRENVGLLRLMILTQPGMVIYFNSWPLDKEKAEKIEKLYKDYREMQNYVETKAEEIKKTANKLSDEITKFRESNDRNIVTKVIGVVKD